MPLTAVPARLVFTADDAVVATIAVTSDAAPVTLYSDPLCAVVAAAPSIASQDGANASVSYWVRSAATYAVVVTVDGVALAAEPVTLAAGGVAHIAVASPTAGGASSSAPVASASAPVAASVAEYFDTTLDKLGVSDGTYWHYYTETSTTAPPPPIAYVDGIAYGWVGTDPNQAVIPLTVEAGDWLVLGLTTYSPYTGVIPPPGWTEGPSGLTSTENFLTFTKTAVAGDAGTAVTISYGAGHRLAVVLAAYRNVRSVITNGITNQSGGVGSPATAPAVTTTKPNSVIVSVYSLQGNGSSFLTPPANARLTVSDVGGVDGAGFVCVAVSDTEQPLAGVSVPQAAVVGSDSGTDWTVAAFALETA